MKGEKVEVTFGQKEKKRNSQGKDPRTFDENSQGGETSTPEAESQGKDSRTFKEPVERWRVLRKRKVNKRRKKKKIKDKKKNMKNRKNGWWKKAKESIAKCFAAKLKEGEKEKKGEKKEKQDEASLGRWLFSSCLWHRTGCVLTQQQKDCKRGRRRWRDGIRKCK